LRKLVLVVGKDEVEPAAVDVERGPEQLPGHDRALDVPAGSAPAPGRLPRRVLAGLVCLPEGEVARVIFARVGLLLLHLIRTLSRKSSVLRIRGDTEVNVALGLVRVVACDQ